MLNKLLLALILLGFCQVALATSDQNQPPLPQPGLVLPAFEPAIDLEQPTALETRIQTEIKHGFEPFVILPYRPSYLIWGHYFSDPNDAAYDGTSITEFGELNSLETKFQLSLKIPVSENLLGGRWFIAYTNRSFWQSFNGANSRPFRETNHEPEVWVTYDFSQQIFGWRQRIIDLGVSHQSNGQTEPLSRSWNRLYARFIFEKNNNVLIFKPWWRIPDTEKHDENPDIEDYLGRFELTYISKIGQNNLSLMLRNNLKKSNNRGAFELSYSYPIKPNLKGYIQWFNGYGESMIDYNYRHNTLGVGIQLGGLL